MSESDVEMSSACVFTDDTGTWQTMLADELMEKSTITPRTLSILKDDHEFCDPNVLMNLRHDKTSQRLLCVTREPSGNTMTTARRNLRMEHKERTLALHKKMIDKEVEKFKEHLAKIKHINGASSRMPLARKPLKVRFQRIAIRSRSSGPIIGKPSKISDDTEFIFTPPEPKLDLLTSSCSVESLQSDVSLPAVYGNSMYGTDQVQEKGPNTTPTSFCSALPCQIIDVDAKVERFLKDDSYSTPKFKTGQSPQRFLDDMEINYSDENQLEISNTERENVAQLHSAENTTETNFESEKYCPGNVTDRNETQTFPSTDDATKTEQKRKRRIESSAYHQLMSYVCNKTIGNSKHGQDTPATVFHSSCIGEGEKQASLREEKIAMVLGYLKRKKNSPDSTQSMTLAEPITTEKITILQSSSNALTDHKTARANGVFYEHRFRAQRDLIKRQKMQLDERQKKIQELTLTILQEEAKNSQTSFQNTIDHLGEECTLSIRPQLKTLKTTAHQPEFSSAGKIVERMEKRTKEREEKKQIAAERRKLQEEERKRKIIEEEERQRKEEESKKRESLEKIREENIRQREMRERTRKEQERMLELRRRAETFNRRRLCKTLLRALKKLVVHRDQFVARADQYYTNNILKTAFFTWKKWVDEKVEQKLTVARDMYNRSLLKHTFNTFKQELADSVRKRQVADDMYEMRLQERSFRKWSQYTNEQHMQMAESLAEADRHYTWLLMRKVFVRWRAYPQLSHRERDRERRKMVLRQKVKDMLPDFRPISPTY